MSVYLFGKLFIDRPEMEDTQNQLVALAEKAQAGISFDSLDEDDQQAIDELAGLGAGLVFSISSCPGSGDASGLWDEAQRTALSLISEDRKTPLNVTPKSFETIRWPMDYDSRMRKCRLGRLLSAIAHEPTYEKMCVTLVEGAIESVQDGPAERCIEAIMRAVILPWDCISGILYAWPKPGRFDRSEAVPKAIGALQTLPP